MPRSCNRAEHRKNGRQRSRVPEVLSTASERGSAEQALTLVPERHRRAGTQEKRPALGHNCRGALSSGWAPESTFTHQVEAGSLGPTAEEAFGQLQGILH